MAMAITGGYRGRFALPRRVRSRRHLLAANYNYLHGFQYEDVTSALRLDTDGTGLLTVNPLSRHRLLVTRDNATSGTGRALDFGVGVVLNRDGRLGFGVNGVANRIDWTNVERTTYALGNPFLGDSNFIETIPQLIGERGRDPAGRLPRQCRIQRGQVVSGGRGGKGYGGNSFHAGYEYRSTRSRLRGGGMYTRELWNPSGGVGFNMGRRRRSTWRCTATRRISNASGIQRSLCRCGSILLKGPWAIALHGSTIATTG